MSKAKTDGMQGHTINAALRGFVGRIFSVTDDRMTQRGELHAYLVLQSGHQRDPKQRSRTQRTFD